MHHLQLLALGSIRQPVPQQMPALALQCNLQKCSLFESRLCATCIFKANGWMPSRSEKYQASTVMTQNQLCMCGVLLEISSTQCRKCPPFLRSLALIHVGWHCSPFTQCIDTCQQLGCRSYTHPSMSAFLQFSASAAHGSVEALKLCHCIPAMQEGAIMLIAHA